MAQLQQALDAYREQRLHGALFHNIVVAVDDTPPARWALQRAIRVAEEVGAYIRLIHVIPIDAGFAPEFAYAETELREEREREGLALLHRMELLVPEALRDGVALRAGDPARQIVNAAEAYGADLIVLGTHGRGPIAHFLLGSTAESVVRHAHCPVLTVGQEVPTVAVEADAAGKADQVVA